MTAPQRCAWPGNDPLMLQYHDEEWGVPLRDDQKLFEFMVLDAMQAGLSWRIVLHKRETMRQAFAQFDPKQVQKFTEADVTRLLATEGIIRNRQKIMATIHNAEIFLTIQKEFGSFSEYVWRFVNGQPIINQWEDEHLVPATSKESDALSSDLKARGGKFVGSTICYAFMQAAGLVNDHIVACYRHAELA